jgi:hypothetical protein
VGPPPTRSLSDVCPMSNSRLGWPHMASVSSPGRRPARRPPLAPRPPPPPRDGPTAPTPRRDGHLLHLRPNAGRETALCQRGRIIPALHGFMGPNSVFSTAQIGFGNWGSVWLCRPRSGHDKISDAKVAVKLVHRNKTKTASARVQSLFVLFVYSYKR